MSLLDKTPPSLSPGLGAVQEGGDQLAPPILVEDQSLPAGQDSTAEADLGPADGVEAVVGGEAGAAEALRDEHGEGLRRRLARRPREAGVAPAGEEGWKAPLVTHLWLAVS